MLCDCSGFTAWACGLDRRQKLVTPSTETTGGDYWLSTDGVLRDARHTRRWFDLVPSVDVAPGDLVVYPDYRHRGLMRHGHIGVVVGVPPGWKKERVIDLRVIHCSKGNDTHTGDAIQETNGKVFARFPATAFVRLR